MPKEVWREIDLGHRDAAFNMSIDETLLEVQGEQDIPTTLRFLSFSPSCVLVGYDQCAEQEVRVSYCKREGVEINHRITGGGALRT